MIITPSNTGSIIAGAGVGIFGWSLAEKGNKIPFIKRIYTGERKEKMFAWANANKGMSLLALESFNFALHGITSSNAIILALGNTVVNAMGLWLYLPFRQRRAKKAHIQAILHGVNAA